MDNNNSINVLGRAGVLLYVDGKRLPLEGQDLTTYLQNLPAEQIDKIDIISNPGAKYEAEGNAGIIDIRLRNLIVLVVMEVLVPHSQEEDILVEI